MFDKYRRKSGIGGHSGFTPPDQELRPARHNASQSIEEPLVRNFSMKAGEAQTDNDQDLRSMAAHPAYITSNGLKSKTPRVSTLFQDFSIRNEPDTPRNPTKPPQPVFKLWAPDVALLLTAVVLLAAIFATTLSQHNKPQRNWALPITLNSLSNVLSTLFRACIAAVAAEVICQARWTWFWSDKHDERRMIDLQHFDSGSRDVLGALRLGWVVKWRSPATVMAVFVVVSSFAVGPAVQQAIGTVERAVIDPGENASIPTARSVDLDSYFFEAIYRDGEDGSRAVERIMRPEMRIALQTAIQNPRGAGSSVAPACPTGNCTFIGLESGMVQKTQLREKLVSEVPMYHDPMYDGIEHQWVKNGSYLASRNPCVVNGRNYTAEAQAGRLNITTFWAPDAADCIYSVAPTFADGLSSFLNEAFNETCTFSAFQDGNLWCKNNFWLSELWYRGNATVRLVSEHFADIATAVTNQLRRGLGRQQGPVSEVEGQALHCAAWAGGGVAGCDDCEELAV
ncbi:hypothetical protein K4K54_000999 [Colletotrichum sp. SAR 10_86]|nr:hypothetical protein KHU50_007914 [Colletotrichum sp. SAR 10_65]KAI8230113.1 hypothetical protein K4K54_000999 [Colletotrichum sp. SAR 10_86]